jgi:hypothetical protein
VQQPTWMNQTPSQWAPLPGTPSWWALPALGLGPPLLGYGHCATATAMASWALAVLPRCALAMLPRCALLWYHPANLCGPEMCLLVGFG